MRSISLFKYLKDKKTFSEKTSLLNVIIFNNSQYLLEILFALKNRKMEDLSNKVIFIFDIFDYYFFLHLQYIQKMYYCIFCFNKTKIFVNNNVQKI